MEQFIDAYMEAAFWTSEEELEGADNLCPACRLNMERECREFLEDAKPHIEAGRYPQAGHDFWLTRNGHGAGFWEHDRWPEVAGQKLTELSKAAGETSMIVGDDGLIHFE